MKVVIWKRCVVVLADVDYAQDASALEGKSCLNLYPEQSQFLALQIRYRGTR
jgi:hypothetical protein